MLRFALSGLMLAAVGTAGFGGGVCEAQPQSGDSNQAAVQRVVIKRDALHLLSPEQFRHPLSLQATKILEVRSRVEGAVQNVRVQVGAKVSAQEELLRIDATQASKWLDRARASLKAATLKRDFAKSEVAAGRQSQIQLDVAEAELEVAKAELDLAQMRIDQSTIRAPFAGQVTKLTVMPGALVNEGDLLVELRNAEELTVQIPVDRNKIKPGETFTVQLDSGTVPGKVQAILPLDSQWQALRQLLDSSALAVVLIDNRTNGYHDGQTVYSPIVPRQPIAEVPNTALKNSESGNRLIQVLRENMVRDIEVVLLGPVGEGRSYVTGPFSERDEMITETSEPLQDGTIVRAMTQPPTESTSPSGRTPASRTPPPASTSPGF